jgi:uncharacterized protein HemY
MANAKTRKETDEIKALAAFCAHLLQRVEQAHVVCSVLQKMLEDRGVFSDEEFVAVHEEMERFHKKGMRDVLTKAMKRAESEALRQALASLQGPKQ